MGGGVDIIDYCHSPEVCMDGSVLVVFMMDGQCAACCHAWLVTGCAPHAPECAVLMISVAYHCSSLFLC
jgi:hypothetical protein